MEGLRLIQRFATVRVVLGENDSLLENGKHGGQF